MRSAPLASRRSKPDPQTSSSTTSLARLHAPRVTGSQAVVWKRQLVRLLQVAAEHGRVKAIAKLRAGGLRHAHRLVRVIEQIADRLAEQRGLAGRHEQAGPAGDHDFGDCVDRGRDNGYPASHGL